MNASPRRRIALRSGVIGERRRIRVGFALTGLRAFLGSDRPTRDVDVNRRSLETSAVYRDPSAMKDFLFKRPLMGARGEPLRDCVRASSPRRGSVRSLTRTGPRRSGRAKAERAKAREVQIPRPAGAQRSFLHVALNSPPLPVDDVDNPVRALAEPRRAASPTLPYLRNLVPWWRSLTRQKPFD